MPHEKHDKLNDYYRQDDILEAKEDLFDLSAKSKNEATESFDFIIEDRKNMKKEEQAEEDNSPTP